MSKVVRVRTNEKSSLKMSWSFFKHLSKFLDFESPVKGLKAFWETKTPKEKWQMIYDFGSFGSEITQNYLFSTLKTGWLSYVVGAMGGLYYCMLCFTIYFYIDNGHFQGCAKSFCIFGVITTVSRGQEEIIYQVSVY